METEMDYRWCYANPTKAAAEITRLREIERQLNLFDSTSSEAITHPVLIRWMAAIRKAAQEPAE